MNSREKTQMCKEALAKHAAMRFEVGLCGRIADAVSITWDKKHNKRLIVIYEIKVTHGDFISDTKYIDYLPYCNQFYFACPKGVIQPSELPDKCGLIQCYPSQTRIVRTALTQQGDVSKQWDMLHDLLSIKNDNALFRTTKSYRAYIDDKITLQDLGYAVSRKMSKFAESLIRKEHHLQQHEKEVAELQEQLLKLQAVCKEQGIDLNSLWDVRSLVNKVAHYADNKVLTDKINWFFPKLKNLVDDIELAYPDTKKK